jgi:hypothetical protein
LKEVTEEAAKLPFCLIRDEYSHATNRLALAIEAVLAEPPYDIDDLRIELERIRTDRNNLSQRLAQSEHERSKLAGQVLDLTAERDRLRRETPSIPSIGSCPIRRVRISLADGRTVEIDDNNAMTVICPQ